MIPHTTAVFLFHYQLALYTAAITSFLFAIFLILNGRKNAVTRVYAAFTLSTAYWALTQALLGTWADKAAWPQIARLEHFGHVFIPTLFLHFIYVFIERRQPFRLAISYLISFMFFCLVPTRWFIRGIDFSAVAKYTVEPGPLYVIYVAWFVGTIIEALINIRVASRYGDEERRKELNYIFWAALIGYAGGFPNFLYVFHIDVYPINPFSTYLVPLYVALIAYAIVKRQFLNVSIVIRKSLIYSLVVSFLTIGYFGMIYAIEKSFQIALGYQSFGLSLAAFAIMALVFQPLKIGIHHLVDWIFFRAPREELVKRMERLEQEARQSEKLKAVATLAAGMAHEIKNPLTSIKTFAEHLPQRYDDPEFRDKFTRIVVHETEKINTLVQRLLEFAKPAPPRKQPARLSRLIDDTVELLQDRLLDKQITVIRTYADRDEVEVDASQIKQVVLNVLLNSLEALHQHGQIMISTFAINGHLELALSDTGQGISEEDLPRVFDPFYTTKISGTGLGLAVVHGIVKEHGGRVMVDSKLGYGTTVRIQLPHHGGDR